METTDLIDRPLKQLLFADHDSSVRVFCIIDLTLEHPWDWRGKK